ncbi:hypothetical protein RKD54_000177 [Pseudarthrobacter sp. SLBN-100]
MLPLNSAWLGGQAELLVLDDEEIGVHRGRWHGSGPA